MKSDIACGVLAVIATAVVGGSLPLAVGVGAAVAAGLHFFGLKPKSEQR